MALFLIICIPAVSAIIIVNVFERENLDKSPSFGHVVKLTWKQIRDFYRINPERWRYETVLRYDSYTQTEFRVLLYNTADNWNSPMIGRRCLCQKADNIIRIKMSPITALIFNYKRIFNKRQGNISTEILLKSVQKDIKKMSAISQAEIEEANEQIKAALRLEIK